MYHVVFLCTRKGDMTQQQFIDYWIVQHTPLTAKVPGLRSYRCYPAIGQMGEPPAPFDAIAVLAFDDEESCRAGLASEEFKTAVADGPNFQTVEATFGYLAQEFVIV
jgi:uncharacterized protein (TIGR02118 family)